MLHRCGINMRSIYRQWRLAFLASPIWNTVMFTPTISYGPHILYCLFQIDTGSGSKLLLSDGSLSHYRPTIHCSFCCMQIDTGSGTKLPLSDGSLVSLTAYAAGRFCSTAYDATLLCASASFSNASRNLFTLRLGED
jgi:hypothetical protein